MKSEIRERVGCTKKIHIEVERERFDQAVRVTFQNVRKEIQIPGFRKGKAPEEMIMRRFGDTIREEALKEMFPKVLQEAFEAEGLNPVGEPTLSNLHLEDEGPITFDVTVEEMPQVDIEGFNGLEVTRTIIEATDQDVDDIIERMRRQRAVQEEVDREVRDGDVIVVNLQKLDPSGVAIIGEKMENRVLHLDGKSTPSPDFDRQVVGMKKGDSRKVQFTYDESDGELAGTTEGYEVEVIRVFENRIPELTDEFAQEVGEYADVADLREKMLDGIKRHYESMTERRFQSAVIDEFVRQNPFEVPNSMVERIMKSEIEGIRKDYASQDIDEAALRDRMRPDAVRAVQTYIIMEAVKEKQGIDVSREEVAERLESEADAMGVNVRELRRRYIKEGRFDEIRNGIAQNKAYDWIESVVTVKEEVLPRETPESRIITP